jgi:hypothetical protein
MPRSKSKTAAQAKDVKDMSTKELKAAVGAFVGMFPSVQKVLGLDNDQWDYLEQRANKDYGPIGAIYAALRFVGLLPDEDGRSEVAQIQPRSPDELMFAVLGLNADEANAARFNVGERTAVEAVRQLMQESGMLTPLRRPVPTAAKSRKRVPARP